jgi:hypothetical protein
MKTYGGLTLIGWFNLIVAQWLFFRIAYSADAIYLLLWPRPMTGWEDDYVFIGKNRYLVHLFSRRNIGR